MDSIVGETWRPVPGFEGCYEVSDHGRVRSLDRTLVLSNGQVRSYKGRIRAPRIDCHGYHKLGMYVGLVRYQKAVHRLVLEAFVGPCPEGWECRHLNGNPGDNRLENLQWGTIKENQADRLLHGTEIRGEKHYGATLTTEDVLAIRALYAQGESQSSIGRKFKVDKRNIHAIVHRKTWKHV